MTDVDDYYMFVVILRSSCSLAPKSGESRWGRGITAVRESEIAAKSSGVRVYKVKVTAFMISAAMIARIGAMLHVDRRAISPGASRRTSVIRSCTS